MDTTTAQPGAELSLPPLEVFRTQLQQFAPQLLVQFESIISALRKALTDAQSETAKARERLEPLRLSLLLLRRQIFGHCTEKDVAPCDAHQQYIDPSWHAAIVPGVDVAKTQADHTTTSSKPAPKPREPKASLGARFPTLPIEEMDQKLPSELQKLVDSGTHKVERNGECREQLLIPEEKPRIQRVFGVKIVEVQRGETTIEVAPAETVVPNGILADETIVNAAVSKFLDAIPLNRQCTRLERQGIELPRQTLGDAVAALADLTKPLAEEIDRQVLNSSVVYADESWFRTRDPKLRRRCKRVNVWTKVGDGQVSYSYTEDRQHQRALEVIGPDFKGYLVRDEWQGWAKLKGPDQVGCNAHARRPFAKLQEDDDYANAMIKLYGEVYEIERQANASGLTGEALFSLRLQARTEKTRPIMNRIKQLAEEIVRLRPPSHALHVAGNYILNHWTALTKFLDQGCLPPDNNTAENALRIIALIRKNSLFFGSDDAGARNVHLLTILHSCRLQGLHPVKYLLSVIATLILIRNGRPADLSELTPKAWVLLHGQDGTKPVQIGDGKQLE